MSESQEKYFTPVKGAKWITRVHAEGVWRGLYQDHPLDCPGDADVILRALGIPTTIYNIARYFPDTRRGRRCPTLELFELTIVLDPTNPIAKKQKGEVGV